MKLILMVSHLNVKRKTLFSDYQQWRRQHHFKGGGGRHFQYGGKTLKKSSVLTTLYREMPFFLSFFLLLDFTQSWGGTIHFFWGGRHPLARHWRRHLTYNGFSWSRLLASLWDMVNKQTNNIIIMLHYHSNKAIYIFHLQDSIN